MKALRVGKPIEVTKTFTIVNEPVEITLGVLPPGKKMAMEIEGILKEFKDDEEKRNEALEAEFIASKIRPYFKYWKGVEDEDGKPLELTDDTFGQVCEEYPSVHAGMVEAMYDAVPRKAESDRGNSKTSSSTTSEVTRTDTTTVKAAPPPLIGNA
jgi:hypothetical protein